MFVEGSRLHPDFERTDAEAEPGLPPAVIQI